MTTARRPLWRRPSPTGTVPSTIWRQPRNLTELHKALDQLTPVEAWLIRRRFGLGDPHEDSPSAVTLAGTATMAAAGSRRWTYARLGRVLRISVHRVRQVEQSALGKLRSSLQCGGS